MNVEVLNLKEGTGIKEISDYVLRYGSMTIAEMLYIDDLLKKETKHQFSLLNLLNKLIDESEGENKKLLSRVRNCFELYNDIHGAVVTS